MSKKETGLEVIKSKVEAKLTETIDFEKLYEGRAKAREEQEQEFKEYLTSFKDSEPDLSGAFEKINERIRKKKQADMDSAIDQAKADAERRVRAEYSKRANVKTELNDHPEMVHRSTVD